LFGADSFSRARIAGTAEQQNELHLRDTSNHQVALAGLESLSGRVVFRTNIRELRSGYPATRAPHAEHGRATVTIPPDMTDVNITMAQHAMAQGQWQLAADAFKRSLARNRNNAQAWLGWALANTELNKPREAAYGLLRAKALAPQSKAGARAERSATQNLRALAHQWPTVGAAHYHLGHCLLVQQEYAGAEESLRACLELEPNHRAARHALVAVHLARGEPQKALQKIDQFADIWDSKDTALRCIALREAGRVEEACSLDDPQRWVTRSTIADRGMEVLKPELLRLVQEHPELSDGSRTHVAAGAVRLPVAGVHWLEVLRDAVRPELDAMLLRVHDALPLSTRCATEWVTTATLLRAGGAVAPHVHGTHLASCIYHASLPAVASDQRTSAGNVCFGEPDAIYAAASVPMTLSIAPKEGELIAFPGWVWHHTLPFFSSAPRLTIAFSVVARDQLVTS